MKLFLILILVPGFALCENSLGQNISEIKYHITGNVNVKDGTRIAMVRDSKGNTHRQVATINNHKFEFRGKNPEIESARLYYEEDILNSPNRLPFFKFFLAKEVKIQCGNDSIRNFRVTTPDSLNEEFMVFYYSNYQKTCDSIFKSPRYKDLKWEEKNDLVVKKLLAFNVPVNSIVKLEEISVFYHNQEITDSMVLVFLKPIKSELKKSMYYKQLMRNINGKKLLSKGKPYIDLEVEDTLGKKYKISALLKNNTFVVVDFYTSWCRPCRELTKDLSKYYDLCHEKGFEVISISCDDSKDNWKEYIKESRPKWNSYWIDKSDTLCELYDLHAYPRIYRLDENGIITGQDFTGLHEAIEKTFNLEPIETRLRED